MVKDLRHTRKEMDYELIGHYFGGLLELDKSSLKNFYSSIKIKVGSNPSGFIQLKLRLMMEIIFSR